MALVLYIILYKFNLLLILLCFHSPIIYNAVCCFIVRCFVVAFGYHLSIIITFNFSPFSWKWRRSFGGCFLCCSFQGCTLLLPCFNHLLRSHTYWLFAYPFTFDLISFDKRHMFFLQKKWKTSFCASFWLPSHNNGHLQFITF